jgi:hypothetical protein
MLIPADIPHIDPINLNSISQRYAMVPLHQAEIHRVRVFFFWRIHQLRYIINSTSKTRSNQKKSVFLFFSMKDNKLTIANH